MEHIRRINGRQIPEYQGRQVLLVGRVLQSMDQMTTIEASDKQQVRVMGGQQALPQQSIVEFTGVAMPDGSLNETSRMQYSDNFNLENYDQALKLMQQPDLKKLFG